MVFRGVRNQNTWFLKNVCMDACLRACVCVCVCVCAYTALLRVYAVDFNRIVLIFVFLYCIGEENNFVWFTDSVFVLFRIFNFRNISFWIFLIIGLKYLNRIGSIRKRIKKPIFSKKKFLSHHGYFVINKNVFFS